MNAKHKDPEAEFLQLRVRQAKQRMRRTTDEMIDGVLTPFEVKPLVRRHPWSSLGVALVGGFLTGLGLRRRRVTRAAAREKEGLFGRIARTLHRGGRIVRGTIGAMVLANLREAARGVPHRNGSHSR